MGDNLTRTLHFTFGPVQEFVSQSRKTRDLWAGSYLLAYLAGIAMQAVIERGGKIVFPEIKGDHLIRLIQSAATASSDNPATRFGSLPNRFTARVPEGVTGQACATAIREAWISIAAAVRGKIDFSGTAIEDKIWNPQIENLWECQWVIGDQDQLMDQRKNMRCHFSPPEPGEKCTICGQRGELSGASPPLRISAIKAWWKKNIRTDSIADLREGERLCAVCITKRMLPTVAKDAIGWDLSKYFPSTSFMAAIDWLAHMLDQAKTKPSLVKRVDAYVDVVASNIQEFATEYHTMIPFLEKAAEEANVNKGITFLDGNLFHADAIDDDGLGFKTDASARHIRDAFKKLQSELKDTRSSKFEASPFYAILLMDGDGMGRLIAGRDPQEREAISGALAEFTRQIPEIVSHRNGWLIYAGGDDVFALLPVDRALDCATRCRAAYQAAFCRLAPFVPKAQATISAAIEYAHMKTPLGPLVKDAHRLLDGTAKDTTGRDAIACRVWKRGGPILTWTQPWEVVITPDGTIVGDVKRAFQNDTDDPDKFSNKFFYKLKELFDFTNEASLFNESNMHDLLVTEYLAIREHNWGELPAEQIAGRASQRIEKILALCRMTRRILELDRQGNPIVKIETPNRYLPDGALLVRFLSQKEV